jgi:hypothetical protein
MGGQLLAFSGLDGTTDFATGLVARTAFDAPGLDIKLPATARLRFPQVTTTENSITGDTFRLGATVRGVFLDTYHLLIEGPCQVLDADPARLAVITEGNRTLLAPRAHLDPAKIQADMSTALQARTQWLDAQSLPAGLSPAAQRTTLKALSIMKTQVYTPSGPIRHLWTTPDRWPHRKMWLWDSVFHAIGWRHLDVQVARAAISAVLDTQAPDGFIAHMMSPEGSSVITQPPVLALGAKLVYDTAPDYAWLAEIYPKLCAYVKWDMAHRDSDGAGLLEWAIEGNPHCRSGESGMDNSSRFDAATQMDAVDFNAFLARECELLAEFAALLGLPQEAPNGPHTMPG